MRAQANVLGSKAVAVNISGRELLIDFQAFKMYNLST